MKRLFRPAAWLGLLLISACSTTPPQPPSPPPGIPPVVPPTVPPTPPVPPGVVPTAPGTFPQLERSDWSDVDGWPGDTVSAAWPALLRGCRALAAQSAWQAVCADAAKLPAPDDATVRAFFEQRFRPWHASNDDGSDTGTITGYYEPLLTGDRHRTARARYPLYAVPDDLINVELGDVYPELKNLRLRGRLVGNKLVPYAARGEIEAAGFAKAKPIAWAEDPVELFFLQIQGSGRVELPDGRHLRVGYANQNGHPYKSIGKLLVERGELTLAQASMQGIKRWGADHPDQLPGLLAENPSYVFFRILPDGEEGPIGALGVPLTPERSIAIDKRYVPLGAPVFLATTQPLSDAPLDRLVMAQDTGGAIKGGVRADYFWGFGDSAGEQAGRMKQNGRMWVLLPKDYPLTQTP